MRISDWRSDVCSSDLGQRTPISPEKDDMMVITEVPDIFHSGHVHVMDVQNYRGTLIVNSGTWQDQTPFQQTMGIMPTSGIAIAVKIGRASCRERGCQ